MKIQLRPKIIENIRNLRHCRRLYSCIAGSLLYLYKPVIDINLAIHLFNEYNLIACYEFVVC
jgi:hypothetical protein